MAGWFSAEPVFAPQKLQKTAAEDKRSPHFEQNAICCEDVASVDPMAAAAT